jgi:hypothetical protein
MDLHPLFLYEHRRPPRKRGPLYEQVAQIYFARSGSFLLCAQHHNHDRLQKRETQLREDAENEELSEDKRHYAARLLDMKHHVRMDISLASLAAKIDLAAMVRD